MTEADDNTTARAGRSPARTFYASDLEAFTVPIAHAAACLSMVTEAVGFGRNGPTSLAGMAWLADYLAARTQELEAVLAKRLPVYDTTMDERERHDVLAAAAEVEA